MVAMDLVAAALCLVGVVAPPSPDTPVALDAVALGLSLLFAVLLWFRGAALPRAWLLANVSVYVVFTSAIVALAGTGEGAVSASMSFVFVSLYVAAFFPRVVSRPCLAVVVVLSAVALHANEPVANTFATWLPLAMAVVASGELLSSLLEQMRAMTVTDSLTGALNRIGFEHRAVLEKAAASRTGAPLSVVVIDLNDFKSINDHHGHAAGDALLGDLVEEWRTALRPRDVIGRRGGDEFALLLPDTTEQEAMALAERLHDASSAAWSYGVAELRPLDDTEESLAKADIQMYRHKRTPRTVRMTEAFGQESSDRADKDGGPCTENRHPRLSGRQKTHS